MDKTRDAMEIDLNESRGISAQWTPIRLSFRRVQLTRLSALDEESDHLSESSKRTDEKRQGRVAAS